MVDITKISYGALDHVWSSDTPSCQPLICLKIKRLKHIKLPHHHKDDGGMSDDVWGYHRSLRWWIKRYGRVLEQGHEALVLVLSQVWNQSLWSLLNPIIEIIVFIISDDIVHWRELSSTVPRWKPVFSETNIYSVATFATVSADFTGVGATSGRGKWPPHHDHDLVHGVQWHWWQLWSRKKSRNDVVVLVAESWRKPCLRKELAPSWGSGIEHFKQKHELTLEPSFMYVHHPSSWGMSSLIPSSLYSFKQYNRVASTVALPLGFILYRFDFIFLNNLNLIGLFVVFSWFEMVGGF